MRRVVAPLASGVLSALGLIVSERRRDLVESVLLGGEALTREAVAEAVERLGEQARAELGERDAELRAIYDLRYARPGLRAVGRRRARAGAGRAARARSTARTTSATATPTPTPSSSS